MITMLISTYRN